MVVVVYVKSDRPVKMVAVLRVFDAMILFHIKVGMLSAQHFFINLTMRGNMKYDLLHISTSSYDSYYSFSQNLRINSIYTEIYMKNIVMFSLIYKCCRTVTVILIVTVLSFPGWRWRWTTHSYNCFENISKQLCAWGCQEHLSSSR